MALGNSEIIRVRGNNNTINDNVNYSLKNSWNTFQWVAKNLSKWSDETTIGSESVQYLNKLASDLKRLIENTSKLTNVVENFVNNQEMINRG